MLSGVCPVTVPLLFGGHRDDQSSLLPAESDVTGPLQSDRNWDDQSLSFLGMSGGAKHAVTGETGVTNVPCMGGWHECPP